MGESEIFNEITLLVKHYNRSMSLERLLKSYEERQIRFKEIVISEDGSKIGIEKWALLFLFFFNSEDMHQPIVMVLENTK